MKKNKNFLENKGFLSTVGILFCLSIIVGILFWTVMDKDNTKILTYSEFIEASNSDGISKLVIKKENIVEGVLKDGSKFVAKAVVPQTTVKKLASSGTQIILDDSQASATSWLFSLLILLLVGVIVVVFYSIFNLFRGISNYNSNSGNKIFSVGKSHAKFYPADSIKIKFKDVAGLLEAKEDLEDLVDFLKDPKKFSEIGAKIPKGILMSGAPGNGKTLLAKAVAGEAGCPFFSISGSDFVEVFVGVGASRVRDLFAQAKKAAPCIVFIDEIDTVGKQRGNNVGGGNEEREQTLNQLLSEMDGFATEPGSVIVLAATNRVDILDKALTRPGRFDKNIDIPYPDVDARELILNLHAQNVKKDDGLDLRKLAQKTPGCSGADLANIINEAALKAIKNGDATVSMKHLEEAIETMQLGVARKSMVRTEEELLETAYHEGGHTLLNILLPYTNPFHKVTITARRHSLGVTFSLPEKDEYSKNQEQLMAQIMVCLGGLIAEKIALKTQTTGVSNDLEKATSIARNMVISYGMYEGSPISFKVLYDDYGRQLFSSKFATFIDNEVEKIIKKAYDQGEELLRLNEDKLHKLAKALKERETLDAKAVYELLELPPRSSKLLDYQKSAIEAEEIEA